MEKHREGQRKMKGGRTLMIENTGKEKKEDERWAYINDRKGREREKGR